MSQQGSTFMSFGGFWGILNKSQLPDFGRPAGAGIAAKAAPQAAGSLASSRSSG